MTTTTPTPTAAQIVGISSTGDDEDAARVVYVDQPGPRCTVAVERGHSGHGAYLTIRDELRYLTDHERVRVATALLDGLDLTIS